MKSNRLLSLFICFTFLLFSCANKDLKEHKGNTVDLGLDSSQIDERVDISDRKSVGAYGPRADSVVKSNLEKKAKKYYSLVIGPGMYAANQAISFLKCTERLGVKFNVISGFGFGSLIAALYAQGDSLEIIEWKLFNYFGKGNILLSKISTRQANEFINKQIDIKKIKTSSLSLWFPIFKNNKVVFSSKVKIKEYLLSHFENTGYLESLRKVHTISWKRLPTNVNIFLFNYGDKVDLKEGSEKYRESYREILYKFNNLVNPDILSFRLNKIEVIDEYSPLATSALSKTQCLEYASKFWNN